MDLTYQDIIKKATPEERRVRSALNLYAMTLIENSGQPDFEKALIEAENRAVAQIKAAFEGEL